MVFVLALDNGFSPSTTIVWAKSSPGSSSASLTVLNFQLGAITAVDLLQQQTNYLNILNNYMQNKYNFLLQKKVLDVYTGQPITL